MTDIFGLKTEFGDTQILTADFLTLRVGGTDTTRKGFLVQNVTLQYNQPLNRVYEVGTGLVYFAPGRAIGTMQLGRIIGDRPLSGMIPEAQGIWTAREKGNRTVTLKSTGTVPMTISISGAVIESYGFAADANGLLVQENVTIQFASLTFPGGAAAAATAAAAAASGAAAAAAAAAG
jgi:hypothetical protein